MMCVKAWVDMVSVDKVSGDAVSVDTVSVWGTGVFLVHRAGRFCRMSLSIAAQVVWMRSVRDLDRVWWSRNVVVVDGMIGAAGFVLPWEVICCYIFDEEGGDGGDEIGGWQRREWKGGMIERDGKGYS